MSIAEGFPYIPLRHAFEPTEGVPRRQLEVSLAPSRKKRNSEASCEQRSGGKAPAFANQS